MRTKIARSNQSTTENTSCKLNYLWLHGERVIGIEGLQVSKHCGEPGQETSVKPEQVNQLNSIINSTLEKSGEDGICTDWPEIISAAKNYLSETGYCVTFTDNVIVDLRKPVKIDLGLLETEKSFVSSRSLTAADLWNIYQNRRQRPLRRFL